MPDDTQMGLRQRVAELERILAERTAERDEARAREAAMAEVLHVINSSPGNLAPVFDAIVEKAHTLCGAVCGSLPLWDGEKFRGIAMRGFPEPMVESLRQGYSPGPNHPCRGLIRWGTDCSLHRYGRGRRSGYTTGRQTQWRPNRRLCGVAQRRRFSWANRRLPTRSSPLYRHRTGTA